MSWTAKGNIRTLVTYRDTDVDEIRPDLDEMTPEVLDQVTGAHAALKALIDKGGLGGQGELLAVKLSGHATAGHSHEDDAEHVSISVATANPAPGG